MTGTLVPDATLDLGALGCGDLVMALALQIQGFDPGRVIAVISYDRGALADVPAWCRMRGHALLKTEKEGERTTFYIERGQVT